MKQILSLGAGVQSSAIALMSEHGDLPKLDAAVFADTGAEPASVYAWLGWLEQQVSFPVVRVMHNDGLEAAEGRHMTSKKTGKRYVASGVPLWVQKGDKVGGGTTRKCTRDYKINPINKAVRRIAKVPRGCREPWVTQWIGISTDEAHRMKPSRLDWSVHWWPLIEHGLSREDCVQWMRDHGYPDPPRSACTFCPFHGPHEWLRLQRGEPEAYEHACRFEDRMRESFRTWGQALDGDDVWLQKYVPGVPLREVDWQAYMDEQQRRLTSPDPMVRQSAQLALFPGWGDECEGMCGL